MILMENNYAKVYNINNFIFYSEKYYYILVIKLRHILEGKSPFYISGNKEK